MPNVSLETISNGRSSDVNSGYKTMILTKESPCIENLSTTDSSDESNSITNLANENRANDLSPLSSIHSTDDLYEETNSNTYINTINCNGSVGLIKRNKVKVIQTGDDFNFYDSTIPTISPKRPSKSFDLNDSETTPLRQHDDEPFNINNFNLITYLKREMLGEGEPGHLDSVCSDNINNFLSVSFKLENFLFFGYIICLDAFLFSLTYLPVRVFYSIVLLVIDVLRSNYQYLFKLRRKVVYFHRTNAYDLIRGYLLLFGCVTLHFLNMSRVYHFIRGQTMIKLYVLTAMMEMLDKLLCTFGQDIFGSLYYQIRTNPYNYGVILRNLVVASIYISMHSSVYFYNIATIAVAVNSSDRALLTVLVLNNVSEIKSFVFKKFDKIALFQLSCSDITERFHISLFLFCIAMGSIAQAGPQWIDGLYSCARIYILFFTSELFADTVKHAFITKFNDINSCIYDEFTKELRNDILNSHKHKIILDQTYHITRRVGLSQIPLGCVFIRYLGLAVTSPYLQEYLGSFPSIKMIVIPILLFIIILFAKTLIGLGLVYYAGYMHNNDLNIKSSHVKFDPNDLLNNTGSSPIDELCAIERYTSVEGRVVG